MVVEASTLSQPQILIGQVQSLLANCDVSLLWYKNFSANMNISGVILPINHGLLKAVADCSERFFKNKDGELSFLDKICTVYSSDFYKTFCASPERNVLST